MTDTDEPRDPVEELAEEFLERHRRGDVPLISEYAEQHPQWAERIRALFPTLLMMEQLKSETPDLYRPPHVEEPHEQLEQLGDFRIVRQIGRGGMGVVYEAEQESLGRRVALKVLPASYSASPHALGRFRREAQAAARLHHTNIVSVFGVGQYEGRHFYVMQYIEGPSLDHVLAELARNRSGPNQGVGSRTAARPPESRSTEDIRGAEFARSLLRGGFEPISPRPADSGASAASPAEAETQETPATLPRPTHRPTSGIGVEGEPGLADAAMGGRGDSFGPAYWSSVAGIGVQVATALHFAHKQGTLHRDVKPGNLLLDDRGTVWITDFGLAKLADQEDLTHPGGMVGTLRYMAPEQFEGEAEPRSDVYSLGLTLYELLTLRPAFDETSRPRLLRQVSRQAPPPPRALDPRIPRDLETIVLKAIAREPSHRYATAGELADDLQRFLEDRPIRARRTRAVEHLWRWCRRNPALAALSASTLLLLVGGVVGSHARFVMESQLRGQAETERQRAEANLDLASQAFEDIFSKLGAAPLPQAFDASGDEVWRPADGRAVGKKDAELLQSLLKFYDQFAEQNRDNARWQRETAMAYRRVGEIQHRLGRRAEAERAFQRALEFYGRLGPALPEQSDYLVDLAAVHNELGRIAEESGQMGEAQARHRAALHLLNGAPDSVAESRGARFELARTLDRLAFVTMIAGNDPAGADAEGEAENVARLRRALAVLEELVAEDPADPEYQFVMALCYQHLWGQTCPWGPVQAELSPAERRQRFEQARPYAEKAVGILEALTAQFPDRCVYRSQLALTLAFTSMHEMHVEGAPVPRDRLTKAVKIIDRVTAAEPNVPEYRAQETLCHLAMARAYWALGRTEYAAAHCQQCVDQATSLIQEFPEVHRYRGIAAHALHSLATVHWFGGQPDEARRLLEEVIRLGLLLEESREDGHPARRTLSDAYRDLAEVVAELGETEAAQEARQKAEQYGLPSPRGAGGPMGPLHFGPPGEKAGSGAAQPTPTVVP